MLVFFFNCRPLLNKYDFQPTFHHLRIGVGTINGHSGSHYWLLFHLHRNSQRDNFSTVQFKIFHQQHKSYLNSSFIFQFSKTRFARRTRSSKPLNLRIKLDSKSCTLPSEIISHKTLLDIFFLQKIFGYPRCKKMKCFVLFYFN